MMRLISSKIGYKGATKYTLVEVHRQLCNNGHPMDGALVGAGSFWDTFHLTMINSLTNCNARAVRVVNDCDSNLGLVKTCNAKGLL
jgi:hypothetical protein